MPALRPACWIFAILGLLIVGCSGGKGDATSPVPPLDPLAGAVDPLVSPERVPDRGASNVIEGEVILAGSAGGSEYSSGPQSIDIPVTGGPQFGIVELEATTLNGTSLDPQQLAYAGIGHAIGAYSTVPPTTGLSNYGIPRTDEQRTFARHFPADGALELRLTNQPSADGPANPEPIKWKYRIATTPDPPLVPNGANRMHAWPVISPLAVNQPVRDTLVRGYAGRNWQMARVYRISLRRQDTYRFALNPISAPHGWIWHMQLDGGGLGERRDIAIGSPASIDIHSDLRGTNPGGRYQEVTVRVWADVPSNEPVTLEVGAFELTVTHTPLTPPVVEKVTATLFGIAEAGRPPIDPENLMYLREHQPIDLQFHASVCPCTYELSDAGPLLNGDPSRAGLSALERLTPGVPGTYRAQVTATNSAGTSAPFEIDYRILPSLPVISLVPPDNLVRIVPTVLPIIARERVTTISIDYGADALPQFATSVDTPVRFLTKGAQMIKVSATNEQGTTTREFKVVVESESDQLTTFGCKWSPSEPGRTMTFAATSENVTEAYWCFPDEPGSPLLDGLSVSLVPTTPGRRQGLLGTRSASGDVSLRPFLYIVNPPGTSMLPLTLVSSTFLSQRYQLLECGATSMIARSGRHENGESYLEFAELPAAFGEFDPESGWDAYPPLPIGESPRGLGSLCWNVMGSAEGPVVVITQGPTAFELWTCPNGGWQSRALELDFSNPAWGPSGNYRWGAAIRDRQLILAAVWSQPVSHLPRADLFRFDLDGTAPLAAIQTVQLPEPEYLFSNIITVFPGSTGVVVNAYLEDDGRQDFYFQPMEGESFTGSARSFPELWSWGNWRPDTVTANSERILVRRFDGGTLRLWEITWEALANGEPGAFHLLEDHRFFNPVLSKQGKPHVLTRTGLNPTLLSLAADGSSWHYTAPTVITDEWRIMGSDPSRGLCLIFVDQEFGDLPSGYYLLQVP